MSAEIPDRLVPLDLSAVEIDDEFWNPRLEAIRNNTLEYQYEQLGESGVLHNFRVAAGRDDGEFKNMRFADSDAYKWLEAASYAYENDPDPVLDRRMDEVIELIAAAQEEDGYLNTSFTIKDPDKKWTNLGMMHELYCAGHLFEAGAAHYRATGKKSLLDVATAFADHIDDAFGPEARRGYPGHSEIEVALVKLYRVTNEDRYLDLASFFIDERGQDPSLFEQELKDFVDRAGDEDHYRYFFIDDDGEFDGSYAQEHAPVREQDTVEGHSVRAMYLYEGMADVHMEAGDDTLLETLKTLWQNMTDRRMYVTGGIGSTHAWEGFTEDYDLPNDSAYTETCAAVGSIFWNHRMQQITREARFADVLERALYNGFLAGISLSGDEFFYVNPLESDGDHHRRGWFNCACCPPNASRLLTSLGRYLYTATPDGSEVYTNLYVSSNATVDVDGTTVDLNQETNYPWDGDVTVTVSTDEPVRFALNLRVPDWCRDATLSVTGERRSVDPDAGYVTVDRLWKDGEQVELTFGMPVERVQAHPDVDADTGKRAVCRGPLVYCLEGVDNPEPLNHILLGDDEYETTHQPDLLDGVTTIEWTADRVPTAAWDGELYQCPSDIETTTTDVVAVPYYTWDNRDPGEMQVWIRES